MIFINSTKWLMYMLEKPEGDDNEICDQNEWYNIAEWEDVIWDMSETLES